MHPIGCSPWVLMLFMIVFSGNFISPLRIFFSSNCECVVLDIFLSAYFLKVEIEVVEIFKVMKHDFDSGVLHVESIFVTGFESVK